MQMRSSDENSVYLSLLREILGKTDNAGAKQPIFDLFSLVAP